MRTNRLCLAMVFAAGCQAAEPSSTSELSTTEQEVGSFCNATLPPIVTYVPGQTFIPTAPSLTSSGYVVFQDWVNGGFLAALVDLSQNKITNAFAVSNGNLPLFMYYQTFRGRIIVPNTPPPPHPGGGLPGLARYAMELELASSNVSKDAQANAFACPP